MKVLLGVRYFAPGYLNAAVKAPKANFEVLIYL